jgi:hypothetical protein
MVPVDVVVEARVRRIALDGGVGGTGVFIRPRPRYLAIFFRQFEPVGAKSSSSIVSSGGEFCGELEGLDTFLWELRAGVVFAVCAGSDGSRRCDRDT